MAVENKPAKPGMEVASLTDVGRHRENNEDSYLYWEPDSDEELRRKGRLAVIADGMGGYEGGQEASRLAVETVRRVYNSSFNGDASATLLQALNDAHDRIQEYAALHPELRGMGTTCTAVAVIGHLVYFAHVGDSRLYLVRGDSISRLTRDHSYVGRLVENGIVAPEDAENHPQRHILTAALGSGKELEIDSSEKSTLVKKDDKLVLCTDGLWGVVSEQNIARVVRSNSPVEACRELVQIALDQGGPDNITLQVLRVTD